MRIIKSLKSKKWYIFIFLFFSFLFLYISTLIIKPNIQKIPYSTIILDENDIRIWEIIKDKKYRHEKVEYSEIPDFSKKVIISLEDKTFYDNSWVDLKAIIRALINNFYYGKSIEWASTISTQVIRNNYWLNEERTYTRKLKEFYLAIALNNKYSKEEILSNYLSTIYFWYLNYWLKSASYYYFWKSLNNLTKAEQIALLSLPKNPKKYDPYTKKTEFKKRFKQINYTLLNKKLITQSEYESIINEKLEFNTNHENKLPYIVDFIRSYEKYEKNELKTTIDYNLTKKIEEIGKNSIIPLLWKNVKDYSVIIIDRNTKEIKVLIWWINYYGENWQVNMVKSPRQVWSTLKPFTYTLAFEKLWYRPETTILDLPTQFQTNLWYAYTPRNYSLDYKWEVSIAEALSQSINIPAVTTLEKVWVQNLLTLLRDIWITSLDKDADYYWLALTLWVSEISLFELTRAYSIFAYDWKFCDYKIINNEKWIVNSDTFISNGSEEIQKNNCKQIIEKKYTDMIKEILINRYNKIEAFPINWNLDFPDKEVFLKTGTSRNFKDNWTIWFTKNYIIWVWAGNKDWSEMKWVSWATWAWEIFKNIVDYLEKNNWINEASKIEKNSISYLEITSPLNWSKYQIDLNKPKNTQKIKLDFSTNLVYDNYKWFINWEENKSDYIELISWEKEVKIFLYREWKIIWEEKILIYIQ